MGGGKLRPTPWTGTGCSRARTGSCSSRSASLVEERELLRLRSADGKLRWKHQQKPSDVLRFFQAGVLVQSEAARSRSMRWTGAAARRSGGWAIGPVRAGRPVHGEPQCLLGRRACRLRRPWRPGIAGDPRRRQPPRAVRRRAGHAGDRRRQWQGPGEGRRQGNRRYAGASPSATSSTSSPTTTATRYASTTWRSWASRGSSSPTPTTPKDHRRAGPVRREPHLHARVHRLRRQEHPRRSGGHQGGQAREASRRPDAGRLIELGDGVAAAPSGASLGALVFDGDGKQVLSEDAKKAYPVRVDASSVLLFSRDPRTSYGRGRGPDRRGPGRQADAARLPDGIYVESCSWNEEFLTARPRTVSAPGASIEPKRILTSTTASAVVDVQDRGN